jgi:hypothetical protein
METKYPIVKIDRTTAQEFLPILMNKGIFSNYLSLPKKEEILKQEKIRLGVTDLSSDAERSVLSAVGEYRTEKNVIRDFGDYIIAFSPVFYLDYLKTSEEELNQGFNCASEQNNKIQEALKRLKLYRLSHKLVLVILARCYCERRFKDVVIIKRDLIEMLGYKVTEKRIYEDINDAMFSLFFLNYQIFRYKKGTRIDSNYKQIGNFIYDITADHHQFIIDVNERFVGCVGSLFNDKKDNTPAHFARGYLSYPTSIIPASKDGSTAAYLLSNFLIMEKGNAKLKQQGYKVIAFKVSRFMQEMNIRVSRASKRKSEFLKALAEVKIIANIEPSITDLNNITPGKLEDIQLRIRLKSNIKALDSDIKSTLLGAKSPE